MPSWNIHIAHVEQLLDEVSASELGIADENDFLFGNLAPDVYVGYMVPDVTHKIPYRETHFADPGFIPAPDASLFYRRYIRDGDASDVTLGAWTHLLCDHYYNLRTIEFIDRIGVKAGDETRIRKQGDFNLYGRTLNITRKPRETEHLLESCARFPMYPIVESDARGAVEVAGQIVERNRAEHLEGTPDYSLLTVEFFSKTSDEVRTVLREAMCAYAAGEDASRWGGYPT